MVATLPTLKGRYRIDEKIATGGMGIVYSATDERLDRRVAIKLLDERLAEDPAFVERFRREARAVAALAHPNIARVFDYAEDNEHHFIVMELVEGHDLANILRDQGPLPLERATGIAAQICTALDHAHAAGIVHRDMKPANIMVGPDDHVKVTDFGIARAIGETKLTVTGAVMGSAHYISPEQASGAGIGPASDIYSTGVVLYEMLTGDVPFTGESLMSVAARHITDTVPLPSAVNGNVPPDHDAVVARATAKEPRDRYPDASTMGAALTALAPEPGANGDPGITARLTAARSTAVLEEQGEPEQPQTVWPIPGARWDPHRIGRWVVGIFVALAAIAGALLLARLGDTDSPRRAAPAEAGAGDFRLPDEDLVIGANYLRMTSVLDRYGQPYEVVLVDPEEFGTDLPEGSIVATEPAPGATVAGGQTITLYVSSGDEEGPGSPDDSKGKGKPEGKAKGKEKD